jgi:hypothetical protein
VETGFQKVRTTILIFLLCLAGCKTKQKSFSGSADIDYKLKTETNVDSLKIASTKSESSEDQFTETEESTVRYVAIDSAGIVVLKPETKILRVSTGSRKAIKIEQLDLTDLKADRNVDLDSAGKNDYKADEVEKPTDVVGGIVGALFPSWLKIAGLIVGLITTTIVTRVYIKKAKAKQFSE